MSRTLIVSWVAVIIVGQPEFATGKDPSLSSDSLGGLAQVKNRTLVKSEQKEEYDMPIDRWLKRFDWLEKDPPTEPHKNGLDGTQDATFYSSTVNKTISYVVWLPPDYGENPVKRYPVVYFLPGASGEQYQVGSFLHHLEKAITAGKAPGMIVIGVNGIVSCSFYVNSYGGHLPLESIIINDLIPHVDATYRTLAQSRYRGVEGFSMGGYGAAHLGFKYPDTFGVISIHSGAIFDTDIAKNAKRKSNITRAWYYPFGADEAYYNQEYPFALVRKNASAIRGKQRIRIGLAEKDPYPFIQKNMLRLHEVLDALKIENEYFVVPDVGHNKWRYYDMLGFDAFDPFYLDAFAADNGND